MIHYQTELNIKVPNGGTMQHQSVQYITKQLEYVTKDHITMYTILFKLKRALFFS